MFLLRRFLIWAFRIWSGKLAMTHFKRKGLLVYLRTLQVIRKSVLAAIAFFCLIQLMIFGAIGTFVTGVLLTNQDPVAKLWILLAGFLLFFGLPFIGLVILFSERAWLKASGAQEYFQEEKPAPSQSPAHASH
jgi:hypothetical protein